MSGSRMSGSRQRLHSAEPPKVFRLGCQLLAVAPRRGSVRFRRIQRNCAYSENVLERSLHKFATDGNITDADRQGSYFLP